jgi:hypothetical protein
MWSMWFIRRFPARRTATPDLVAEVGRQRREVMPLEEWDDRVLVRDERLMEFAACARQALADGPATIR